MARHPLATLVLSLLCVLHLSCSDPTSSWVYEPMYYFGDPATADVILESVVITDTSTDGTVYEYKARAIFARSSGSVEVTSVELNDTILLWKPHGLYENNHPYLYGGWHNWVVEGRGEFP